MAKSHSTDMASSVDAEAHIARLRRQLEPHCHPRLASLMINAVDLFVGLIGSWYALNADVTMDQNSQPAVRPGNALHS